MQEDDHMTSRLICDHGNSFQKFGASWFALVDSDEDTLDKVTVQNTKYLLVFSLAFPLELKTGKPDFLIVENVAVHF
jgi:hypothetical protein